MKYIIFLIIFASCFPKYTFPIKFDRSQGEHDFFYSDKMKQDGFPIRYCRVRTSMIGDNFAVYPFTDVVTKKETPMSKKDYPDLVYVGRGFITIKTENIKYPCPQFKKTIE